MLGWFKKTAAQSKLPPGWTPDLWDEIATKENHEFDLQCFVGIENFSIDFDFHAHYGDKIDSVRAERRANGFIGARPGTRLALLRASFSFVADPESQTIFGRLPNESAGWGQTTNSSDDVPGLSFTLFLSAENQRLFEELFIRAKMLHIDHVGVSIWAQSMEPWWDVEDPKYAYAKVFNIQRVICLLYTSDAADEL